VPAGHPTPSFACLRVNKKKINAAKLNDLIAPSLPVRDVPPVEKCQNNSDNENQLEDRAQADLK